MANEYLYHCLAPIDGLHLTCDFAIYSAALYGCPPNYQPTPVGVHETYRHPYEYQGSIQFGSYEHFADIAAMDDLTVQAMSKTPFATRMKDRTCIAFEIELDRPDCAAINSPNTNNALLSDILERGDRILDAMRLYLFKPGQDRSIGKVGALGKGIYGAWIGNDNDQAKFIARSISRYDLVQDPIEVGLEQVRRIYNDQTFQELRVAVCLSDQFHPVFNRVFDGLHTFRESRESQSWEARFRQLAVIAEDLARTTDAERLSGNALRTRIAQIVFNGWYFDLDPNSKKRILPPPDPPQAEHFDWDSEQEVRGIVSELWDAVRNRLSHTMTTFTSMQRDPERDLVNMERIVISMFNAIIFAWWQEQFYDNRTAYDILLGQNR